MPVNFIEYKFSRLTSQEKSNKICGHCLLATLELSVCGLKDGHKNVCGSIAYADSLLISEVALSTNTGTQRGMHCEHQYTYALLMNSYLIILDLV